MNVERLEVVAVAVIVAAATATAVSLRQKADQQEYIHCLESNVALLEHAVRKGLTTVATVECQYRGETK